MTREEQIKDFANSQVDCEFFDDSLYKGIIIGAKWADDNQPCIAKIKKDNELFFLLKKRELIKKACEWLDENIDAYSKVIIAENSIPTIVLTEDFEFRFKKAMEG